MLKKVGLPLLALAALLMVMPAQKANAAVRFGVAVGGPVYAYPAYPGPYAYPPRSLLQRVSVVRGARSGLRLWLRRLARPGMA